MGREIRGPEGCPGLSYELHIGPILLQGGFEQGPGSPPIFIIAVDTCPSLNFREILEDHRCDDAVLVDGDAYPEDIFYSLFVNQLFGQLFRRRMDKDVDPVELRENGTQRHAYAAGIYPEEEVCPPILNHIPGILNGHCPF